MRQWATSAATLRSLLSFIIPPPMPVPRVKSTKSENSFPVPIHFSPSAAAFASFSINTGTLNFACISFTKLIPFKTGILGESTMVPLSLSIKPATPRPIPATSSEKKLPVIVTREERTVLEVGSFFFLITVPSLETKAALRFVPPRSIPIASFLVIPLRDRPQSLFPDTSAHTLHSLCISPGLRDEQGKSPFHLMYLQSR